MRRGLAFLTLFCLVFFDLTIAFFFSRNNLSQTLAQNKVLSATLTDQPSSTLTSTPTLTPSPTPTLTPSPVQSRIPTLTQAYSGGLRNLLDQVNTFRSSNGLSLVQSDLNTCNFAATRAQEISSSFDHSGFDNRISSHSLPYSSYHEITENIAMNSDQSQIVQMWIDSPEHNENMRKDTPYVCIQSSGSYYAYEGWRP